MGSLDEVIPLYLYRIFHYCYLELPHVQKNTPSSCRFHLHRYKYNRLSIYSLIHPVSTARTHFVPVDLQSTGRLTAGLRPARMEHPQLQPRGLQIPEDTRKTILCRGLACLSPECTGRADTRSTPTGNTQGVAHVLMSSASVCSSLWICNPQGNNCGFLVHFFFA